MGRIYCVMGKSASGKDSIYHEVMKQEPELLPIVPYTTRPIRQGEIEGREYHFCDETRVEELEKAHRIIELRANDTVSGNTLQWPMSILILPRRIICIL